MDLSVPVGPGLPQGLVIPESELVERFSKSSGPGGQSVNTTDSRVELSWDPRQSRVLTDTQRQRVTASRARLPLVTIAHQHRSQHRNRMQAREQLGTLVRTLLAPPPPSRRATKPTRGSQRRRLATKRERGEVKQLRRKPNDRTD